MFVRGSTDDSFDLRIAAACRVITAGHIACDRTAAWIHGVNAHGFAEQEVLPPIEACVLPAGWATRAAGVLGRSRDLLPDDIEERAGLRVTTPLRTALDLACNLHQRDALGMLDQFHRLQLVESHQLLRELPRFRGRRGVVQARNLVPLIDGRAESVRESWLRLAVIDAGLPAPEIQVWVDRDGIPTYRLDLAYLAHRIALEYDGADFHRSPEQRAHDLRRRTWLREQGWIVIVVGNGDFSAPRLDEWIRRLRRALEERYCNLRW